jgi:hypothetical protein
LRLSVYFVEAVAMGIDRGGNVLAIDFESGWAEPKTN